MYRELERILPNGAVLYQEPLKKYTTFKIGGPADVLVAPRSEEELLQLLRFLKKAEIRFIVIGNGSNLLFPDDGFRGAVIRLGTNFSGITSFCENESYFLHAKAGTLLSRLACTAYEQSLCGLEFAAGIPGSVGGAVWMNAGAYGGEISQTVVRTSYLQTDDLSIHVREGAAHGFSYRHSVYQEEKSIILSADFLLSKGQKDTIACKMKEYQTRRAEKQPLNYPSAGSAFKRPQNHYAGQLIEECGLRGFRHGGAMVSEKHCGFIINAGGATCEDVLYVIEYVRHQVLAQKGVLLEPEIKVIEG